MNNPIKEILLKMMEIEESGSDTLRAVAQWCEDRGRTPTDVIPYAFKAGGAFFWVPTSDQSKIAIGQTVFDPADPQFFNLIQRYLGWESNRG